jgi:hypothetical protein
MKVDDKKYKDMARVRKTMGKVIGEEMNAEVEVVSGVDIEQAAEEIGAREKAEAEEIGAEKGSVTQKVVDFPMKEKMGGRMNKPVVAEVDRKDSTAQYLRFALTAWDLPPVDLRNEEQVSERIRMYLQYCMESGIKPQIVGVANWLGVAKGTLANWKNGHGYGAEAVDKAFMVLEDLWADWMLNGKINPVAGIFLAKTWFGYREASEYVITPGKTEEVSTEELIAEAKMLPQNGN